MNITRYMRLLRLAEAAVIIAFALAVGSVATKGIANIAAVQVEIHK